MIRHLITTALLLIALVSPAQAISIDAAPTVAPGAQHVLPKTPSHTQRRTRHKVYVAPRTGHRYTTGPATGPHYRNVNGVSVHRPMRAAVAPAGACAQCNDGTYSFSQHHRGTCSHHGGVRTWL